MKRPIDCCNFATILLRAIDEALMAYGKHTRKAFYEHFEFALNIKKQEIPARSNDFVKGLEDLFGRGAGIIEILIMMKIHSKIGIVWEYKVPDKHILPDLTFEEYLNYAKKYFEEYGNLGEQTFILAEEEAQIKYR